MRYIKIFEDFEQPVEVSSVSNFETFQSNRMKIRFKKIKRIN